MNALEQLFERADELSTEFDALDESGGDRSGLTEKVSVWLNDCVALGTFLVEGSPERRALQGQVDYWTSLLRRHRIRVSFDRLYPFDPEAGIPLEAECPYPGLRAYGLTNEDRRKYEFLGRDAEIEEYCEHLRTRAVLSVVAGSGAGKSSIILAGVLPRLQVVPVSTGWIYAPRITPGADPITALAQGLTEAFSSAGNPPWIGQLLETLKTDSVEVVQLLEPAAGQPKLVLFLDQFEELFSLCRNAEMRERFSTLLCALAEKGEGPDGRYRIIITMRTDHLGALESKLPELYRILTANERRPGTLLVQQLRQVIEKPARSIGLRFVPSTLVDRLAGQAASLMGGLPLLQYALRRLWSSRPRLDGKPLDLINETAYKQLPDVEQALGIAAKNVYESLPGDLSKGICRRVFLELAVLAESFDEPLRRRRLERELVEGVSRVFARLRQQEIDAVEPEVASVVERFVEADLLIRTGTAPNTQIEVAHEALFRHWPQFRDWLHEEKDYIGLRDKIEHEAEDWSSSAERADLLKQKGESLEGAMMLDANGWLGEEAGIYVRYCKAAEDEVKRALEKAALAEKLQFEKATAEAEAQRERANRAEAEARERVANESYRRAVAEAKTKAQTRLIVGIAVFFLLFTAGVVAFLNQQTEREKSRAYLNMISTLQDRLPPLEALDLTYTLAQKNPISAGPLAHAMERLANTKVFAPRTDGIRFAGGGSALVQVSKAKDRSPRVLLHLLDDSKRSFPSPKTVKLNHERSKEHDLAAAEVSPPTDGSERTAVLIWQMRGIEKGAPHSEQGESRNASSGPRWVAQIFRLRQETNGEAQSLPVIKEKVLLSDSLPTIAFSENGKRVLITTSMRDRSGRPKGTIYELTSANGSWVLEPLNDRSCLDTKNDDGKDSSYVTAAVFLDDERCPATARLDGTIACPDGRTTLGQRGPPAKMLLSGGKHHVFVSYHDLSLVLRTCRQAKKKDEGEPPPLARGVVTFASFDPGKPRFIAVVNGEVRCWKRVAERSGWKEEACLPGVQAYQAAFAPNDQLRVIDDPAQAGMTEVPFAVSARQPNELNYLWSANGNAALRWTPGTTAPLIEYVTFVEQQFLRHVPLSQGSSLATAAISSEGAWVAYVDAADLYLVDTKAGKSDALPVPLIDRKRDQKTGRVSMVGVRLALGTESGNPVAVIAAQGGELRGAWKDKSAWVALQPRPLKIENSRGEEDEITCLAISSDSNDLLVGTNYGQNLVYEVSAGKWTKKAGDSVDASVTACAIADDGTAVIGSNNGKVYILPPGGKNVWLTQRVTFRFSDRIAAVSIDPAGRYASALGSWQAKGCSREGLPGQTIRIWRSDGKDESVVPVSNRCFPNTRIDAIAALDSQSRLAFLARDMVLTHICEGCSAPGEEDAVHSRLLVKAKGTFEARIVKDNKVKEKYGITLD